MTPDTAEKWLLLILTAMLSIAAVLLVWGLIEWAERRHTAASTTARVLATLPGEPGLTYLICSICRTLQDSEQMTFSEDLKPICRVPCQKRSAA